MSAFVFWLPKPPDNANGRLHWAVANRQKKRYWSELAQRAAARHGIPAKPASPFAKVEIAVDWFAPRAGHVPDVDNAVRRLKPAFDWLVSNGYLAGDTPAHMRLGPLSVLIGGSTGVRIPPLCTVRLTITPVSDGE